MDPLFVMAQAFGSEDPRGFGFDGALEFPPHKVTSRIPMVNSHSSCSTTISQGQVFDYADVVSESLMTLRAEFPLIKTAFPNWDNNARRRPDARSPIPARRPSRTG